MSDLHQLIGTSEAVPPLRPVRSSQEMAACVEETRSPSPVESHRPALGIVDRAQRPEELARGAVGDQRAAIERRRRRWLALTGLVMIGLGILVLFAAAILSG